MSGRCRIKPSDYAVGVAFITVILIKLRLLLSVAVAAFGAVTTALADNLTVMGVLTGTCTSATAMDVVMSLCANKVMNVELPNHRLGFIFFLHREGEEGSITVSFFGDGLKLDLNPDNAMQPIDRIDFNFEGGTDHLVAAGSCRFSNLYAGVPAQVSCSADTNEGKFAGEFISNGRPPDMTQTR